MLSVGGGNKLANLGAFNGQIGRRAIIEAVLKQLEIQTCVETGTYLGETAQALADYSRPVFTVEADPERYELVRERFAGSERVRVFKNDSRSFLHELRVNPTCPLQRVLFYLDAHWFYDLPLRGEVEWIVRHWRRSVIVVDDFQVPSDPGYQYDQYPNVGDLTPEYLKPLQSYGLRWFWPTLPAVMETGARRGCVVLAWEPEIADRLAKVSELREARPDFASCDDASVVRP